MNNVSNNTNTIEELECSILSNINGFEIGVFNYGASLASLKIPLSNGQKVDIVLGFDTVDAYMKSFELPSAPYFGAIVGRYAGRISKGLFNLNNKQYQLYQNNNENSLHGGKEGFSQKKWTVVDKKLARNASITLEYISPADEENYPGELKVQVTYTLSEANELIVEYVAKSTEDTIINLTHHSYFNLDGHQGSIENQELMLPSYKMVETNTDNIPTGNFVNLKNHVFNYNTPKKCPTSIDNTFVVNDNYAVIASLYSPKNKLKMEVYTNQPGVHIYVGGNCFGLLKGKENTNYHPLSGICFETQNYPDAPNHSNFPNATLKKGEHYYHKTIYKFQLL
jgi:aldose 1-epimerase